MRLKHAKNDFSLILKTTPTLKGGPDNSPLGNSRGVFSVYFNLEKFFLGCQ